MSNYALIDKKSLLFDYYLYADVPDRYGEEILMDHGINIGFGKTLTHPDHKYILVSIKILKKDCLKFDAAMEDLERKILLTGHSDYPSVEYLLGLKEAE